MFTRKSSEFSHLFLCFFMYCKCWSWIDCLYRLHYKYIPETS